jgi:alpha-L-fucosidase
MHWFDQAKFGMFVHWTHCSTRGFELSWPLVGGSLAAIPNAPDVAVDDYYRDALSFSPTPGAAKEWMALAANVGMRYAILTTKHHDGFALWPTKRSDFSIAQTPYGGDLVGEYVEAARSAGLRVGFYYSLSDWHHPDYPAFREQDKPYPKFLGRRSDTWDAYVDAMFGQVRELLTDYGEISLLWFDGQWERTRDEWKADELTAMIRELQPDILINDRLPGGDYDTPEQAIPATVPSRRWETCMTMNRSWGYVPDDTEYKSSTEIVHTLCEIAGKSGNLLLNVSPRGDGSLPPEQISRLEAVGEWIRVHGDAIYGTQAALEPWQFYGPSTKRDDGTIYLHCLWRPYEDVVVRGLPVRRVSARHLATGRSLALRTRATAAEEIGSRDPIGEVFIELPEELIEPHATVIELRIAAG